MTAEHPIEEAHRDEALEAAGDTDDPGRQEAPVEARPSEPNWQLIFERLDSIEQHQSELSNALWAQLHRRLDRIEQNQADLRRMAMELAGALETVEVTAGSLGHVLGSPIDALWTPAPPVEAGAEPGPLAPSPATPSPSGAAPETTAAPAGSSAPGTATEPERLLPPSWVPVADPATEPAWLAASLPEGFSVTRPTLGRRRWFFGRRRDSVVTAAPGLSWLAAAEPGDPPAAPPPPPGFVWSAGTGSPERPAERAPAPETRPPDQAGPVHGSGAQSGNAANAALLSQGASSEAERAR